MVNWTWYPSGGDWTYIENLSFVYKSNGHQIIPFSMQHNENFESEYSKFFIKKIDYKSLHQKNKFVAGLDVISRGIYSFEAVNKLKALLKHVKIELAHINIIHRYITPSILKVLKDNGIPIVWTLHDYTIICPESTFISDGKICEACKGGKFYQAGLKKCKKQSFLASSVAALENYFHHYLNYYNYVDAFICPSKFHYQKFKEFGFLNQKLHQIYHSYQSKEIEEIANNKIEKTEKINTKLYFLCGDSESEDMVTDFTKMTTLVEERICKKSYIQQVIIKDGKHNEKLWREHFGDAMKWLLE